MAKPTLHYGSRTEAVKALRAQNLSTRAIAEKIGIEPKTVTALEVSAGRHRGPGTPGAWNTGGAGSDMALFPLPIRQLLRPHASRRGISLERLISDIVACVAEGNLVDAVLDDRSAGAA